MSLGSRACPCQLPCLLLLCPAAPSAFVAAVLPVPCRETQQTLGRAIALLLFLLSPTLGLGPSSSSPGHVPCKLFPHRGLRFLSPGLLVPLLPPLRLGRLVSPWWISVLLFGSSARFACPRAVEKKPGSEGSSRPTGRKSAPLLNLLHLAANRPRSCTGALAVAACSSACRVLAGVPSSLTQDENLSHEHGGASPSLLSGPRVKPAFPVDRHRLCTGAVPVAAPCSAYHVHVCHGARQSYSRARLIRQKLST